MASIRTYRDLDGISRAAADLVVDAVKANTTATRHLALSGGSTPTRLYETLAAPPYRDLIPWSSVHVWMVDERPVPPDHPDSNYGMIRRTLVDRVPLPPENVHPMITGNESPAHAAAAYEETLRTVLGGLPRFDVVFLGLGEDGHTASLFPHSPALHETRRWVVANPVEKLGVERVTLTFPVLNNAALVVFLVSGHAKAETLDEVLRMHRNIDSMPCQGIAPAGDLVWLVDDAAAQGVVPG